MLFWQCNIINRYLLYKSYNTICINIQVVSAIRRLPIPNVIKCEGLSYETSNSSDIKQNYDYVRYQQGKNADKFINDTMNNQDTELEYGDISGIRH